MNQVNQHDLGEAIRLSREERGGHNDFWQKKLGFRDRYYRK